VTNEAQRLFDHGEGLFEVNPSKLQCYLDCPRQFRFRYIERRPERRAFPQTALGRTVHRALREFYALETGRRSLEELLRLLRRAWDASGYRSENEAEAAFARAEDMLRRYHDLVDHTGVRPLALESKFSVSYPDEGVLVTGRVDRIDLSEDGYVIVDYKTGRFRQDPRSIHESLPLSLYAMAASSKLGSEVTRIVLYLLADGTALETERDPDRLAGDWKLLVDIVEEIRTGARFPPHTGPLCRWCDYLNLCPEGRAEVG